jgi:peptidoglycan hydrolase-like protein with peptidoglycan-binding domain
VAYPLVFPVQGDNTFGDHFWATRGGGIHHAVDIMAPKMTPVVAAASGTVQWVGRNCCTMRIKHDDGWSSGYIHLNNDTPGTDDGQGWGIAPGIQAGSRVSAGQLIGWVGDSGNAEGTRPHLHFELIDPHGVYVDPYESLRAADSGSPVSAATSSSSGAASSSTSCAAISPASLTSLTSVTSLLRRGARGSSVSQLQTFLTAVGHSVGGIDGVFGSKTLSAIRAFQQRQGLTADGVVGPVTLSAITKVARALPSASALSTDSRVLRPGARGTDVKQVQDALELLGHPTGGADGVLGPMTQSAIESFQRASGLTVDGKVGPNTRAQLRAALGLTSC